MSKFVWAMNIMWCIADTLICALAILGLVWSAFHFDKWWMVLVTLVPLMLFNTHSIFVEAQDDE